MSSNPAGPQTRVFKKTGKIMLAVINLVSVQMIASLGGDVKPLALSPSHQLEGDVKEPMTLFEKCRGRRPRCHGLSVSLSVILISARWLPPLRIYKVKLKIKK